MSEKAGMGDFLGKAGKLLETVRPILKALGIDPEEIVKNLGRESADRILEPCVKPVAEALEKDGWTPAKRLDNADTKRHLIRRALFDLLRKSLDGLPFGAGTIADFLRDIHDDEVVKIVSPKLTTGTTTEDFVRMVSDALEERLF